MQNHSVQKDGQSVPTSLLSLACLSARLRSARDLAPETAKTQALSAKVCRGMAQLGFEGAQISESPYWALLEHRTSYLHARDMAAGTAGRALDGIRAEDRHGEADTVAHESADRYVMERRHTGSIAMGACHPVLGWLYWQQAQPDNDEPDYRTLTTDVSDALLLPAGHGDGPYGWICAGFPLRSVQDHENDYDPDGEGFLVGVFACLADEAGMTHDAFARWVLEAPWGECVVPEQVVYLEDMNGFNGYRPVWTRDPRQALPLSLDEDLDDIRHLGELVPLHVAAARRSAV